MPITVALKEAWWSEEVQDSKSHITANTLFDTDLMQPRRGGVALFVSNGIHVHLSDI